MRTQAQSQREVTENLAAAGCSDLHLTIFHTPSPHNQGDDPDPDPNDPDGDPNSRGSSDRDIPEDLAELPEDPLIALARAVHALAWSSFSDPKKLHKFLVQCELNFQDCPHAFCSNRAKVTFAQSYLKGMALAWFKPDLLNPNNYDCPLWMDDYHEFLQELTTNFGLHDAIADTVQQLENLTMKDSSWITKYIMELNHWASQVKDYGSASNKSQSSNSDNKPKSSSSASTLKSNTKGKGKQKDLPKSDIAHLLGKDGKLTSTECQCRMKNNLCLFCGKAGHSTKDCPKSTSHAAKACAATAEAPPALPAEKAEPKN
ncbi:hypothetical protein M404DRAFT_36172 [Pisolithus tinctorius Marx 270]|uniref:CCHC-type domain-containing protein n=1 Tax=Pisolithus tinctorius Marx 270 TaxID=870435 RepID=A0A0C3NC03_PISTI|nr:hypothetical protein M404DRAFT_36172 [Pisolithus tinctorius Marx 270]